MKPELIADNRDRIWATIRSQLENGSKSFIVEGSEDAKLLSERAQSFSLCDPTVSIIEDYVSELTMDKIHNCDVLNALTERGIKLNDKGMKHNIAQVFTKYGFTFKQIKINKVNKFGYRIPSQKVTVIKENKFDTIQF